MELEKVKNEIRNISKLKNVSIQTIWDMFFFENFLYRISLSDYSNMFIFKGGFLLQSILGIESRTTMDLDLKIVSNKLEDNSLVQILKFICDYNKDDIVYTFKKIENIKAGTVYGGKTAKIEGKFYNITKIFSIDFGIGDIVTPNALIYSYKSIINSREFNILSYPIETIIAEKFETLISKGTNNSRVKDLIDIYLLRSKIYNKSTLNAAVINTFTIRNTKYDKKYISETISKIKHFSRIKELFDNYITKHDFANNITFDMCFSSLKNIFSELVFKSKINLSDYNISIDLVRHGADEMKAIGGWSDNHLTQKGIIEIENLIQMIRDHYDLFISSDLNRAKESAEIINKKLNMPIEYNCLFREMNNGDLKNLSKTEFLEKYPGLFYSSLKMDESYPNGESPIEFYKRIEKVFLNLLETNKNKKILIVTHGGVIDIILSLINGYEYSNKLKISPKTGSIIKLCSN
ncbi:MAG: nucleotidyl transferase AbiEii/AbiGii toxin family protein [Bacilli bacterium]